MVQSLGDQRVGGLSAAKKDASGYYMNNHKIWTMLRLSEHQAVISVKKWA